MSTKTLADVQMGLPPCRPSAWLRLALNDLKYVEKQKNVIVDMLTFYRPADAGSDRECVVCLAGAVLYCHSDRFLLDEVLQWRQYVDVKRLAPPIHQLMVMLDQLRRSDLNRAMGVAAEPSFSEMDSPYFPKSVLARMRQAYAEDWFSPRAYKSYLRSSQEFYEEMEAVIAVLESKQL